MLLILPTPDLPPGRENILGSPEVMNYLGGSRYKKGPVLVFFVDDPENKVPLGPVEYNKIDDIGVKMVQV